MSLDDQLFNKFGKLFKKGTYLFHERDRGDEMYVIQEGKIAIIKESGGQETTLAILDKGEFLGEMSILTKKPRTATAKVLEDAKLLVINPSTFEAMIRGDANIAIRMLQRLADRLAKTDNQIENLLLKDSSAKVVHYLKSEAERRVLDATSQEMELTLSLTEISRTIMLDPEEVKRVLAKLLKNELIVQLNGAQFKIPNLKVFQDFYDYLAKREKFKEFS